MADDKVVISFNAVDNVSKTTQKISQEMQGLSGAVKTVGTFIATYLTVETVKATYNIAKLGAEAEETQRAFKNFAKNGDMLVEKLQAISKGVIDDEDAMKSIMKTSQLLGKEGVKNIETLTEIARASSVAFGGDTQTNLDNLTISIARMSERQLTSMGITVDSQKAYMDYAGTIGKSAKDLTDAEKRQAFLNAVIERGTDIVKQYGKEGQTTSEAFQSFETSMKDLMETIGRALLPIVVPALDKLKYVAEKIKEVMLDLGLIKAQNEVEKLTSELRFLNAEEERLANSYKEAIQQPSVWDAMFPNNTTEKIRDDIDKVKSKITETETKIKDLKDANINLASSFREVSKSIVDKDKLNEYKTQMQGILSYVQQFGQSFQSVFSDIQNGWKNVLKSMLSILVDVLEKMIMAWAVEKGAEALMAGDYGKVAQVAGIALAGVGTLEAVKGGVNSLIDNYGNENQGSMVSSSSSSGSSSGGITPSMGSSPIVSTVGSGGGSVVNINLYNPTFLDEDSKKATVKQLFDVAKNMGFDINYNPALAVV